MQNWPGKITSTSAKPQGTFQSTSRNTFPHPMKPYHQVAQHPYLIISLSHYLLISISSGRSTSLSHYLLISLSAYLHIIRSLNITLYLLLLNLIFQLISLSPYLLISLSAYLHFISFVFVCRNLGESLQRTASDP